MNNTNRTILLVEDEAVIAMAQAQTVRGFGYEVIIAKSGEEAVALATGDTAFGLVLMDIDLGQGLSGPEAAQQILAKKSIPIVFLTSHSEREMVEKVRGITRYGYVIKNSGNFVLQSSIEMAFELFEAHEKSRVSEEELVLKSLVLDQVEDHVTITDLNGRIIYVNKPQLDILERSRQEIVGHSTKIYGEDAERGPTQQEIFEKTLRDGVWHGEIVNYAADGSEHIMSLRTQVVHDAKGEIIALCGSATDITDRMRADDALKKSEKLYRTMFESTGTSMILIEDDLTISMANGEFVRNTGYSPEEIIGHMKWIELVHPDDLDRMVEQHRLRREAPESALPAYEFRYITKTGDIRDTLITVQLIPGTRTSIVSLIDITERKRAEKSLQENEEAYQFIANNSVDMISKHSADGTVLFVSPSCERITGYTVSEIIGKPADFLVLPEDYGHVWDVLNSRLEHEDYYQVEHRLPRKDGSIIWVQTLGRLVRDESGRLKEILCNVRDITERKRAEDQIQNLLAEKELLLKEVHHRIKNNMSTMMSMLTLQSDMLKDPTAVAALKDARSRMQSMEVLYDKLYRSENLWAMSIRDYLPPLADEIIAIFPNSAIVKIEKHVEDFVLGVHVLFPLGMIVNELLTNIMKYAFIGSKKGLITISTSIKDNHATIVIGDNGIGIPESTDMVGSTGFGLKLVGILAKQMNGSIRIERGKGTRFVLEFDV